MIVASTPTPAPPPSPRTGNPGMAPEDSSPKVNDQVLLIGVVASMGLGSGFRVEGFLQGYSGDPKRDPNLENYPDMSV